jgi:hypothetical protein
VGVPHLTLLNRAKKIIVGSVVGYIRKRIFLIFLMLPFPTPILANLVPIARHMAMMQTITSCFIQGYDKVNLR